MLFLQAPICSYYFSYYLSNEVVSDDSAAFRAIPPLLVSSLCSCWLSSPVGSIMSIFLKDSLLLPSNLHIGFEAYILSSSGRISSFPVSSFGLFVVDLLSKTLLKSGIRRGELVTLEL